MPLLTEWLVFAAVMALGQFSPGPDMVLLTRTALASGAKAGCWTAAGIACGLAVHAAVAVTGVAIIFAGEGTWLAMGLRLVGAIYLVWLGGQLVKSGIYPEKLEFSGGERDDMGSLAFWRRGLLCNLLNPKAAVFLAGVTSPFLVIGETSWVWSVVLWATIVFEGLILWCAWVFVLQAPVLRGCYFSVARWFDMIFGIVLIALAVVLVCY